MGGVHQGLGGSKPLMMILLGARGKAKPPLAWKRFNNI